jgi:hypothetical protein
MLATSWDFNKKIALVVSWGTIWSIVAFTSKLEHVSLRCENNFFAWHFEIFYMTQPFGFVEEGKEHKFCKSLKYFYGLKQLSIAWSKKIDSYFKDWGLSYSDVDHNLQTKSPVTKLLS